MMKRLFAALLALAMMLSVTAVFAEEEAAAEAPEATAAVPDTLLATVYGTEIRENNEMLQYYFQSMQEEITGNEFAEHYARMLAMNYTLQTFIVEHKTQEAFSAEELAEIQQKAKDQWNNIVDRMMAQYGITDASTEEEKTAARGDVLAMLESVYGYTEDTYIEEIVNGTFSEKVVSELKEADPTIAATDEEVQETIGDLIKQEKEEVANYSYYEKLKKEDPEKAESLTHDEISQIVSELPEEEFEKYSNDAAIYEQITSYYSSQENYNFHYIPEGYRGIIHILLDVDEELLENYNGLVARLEESKSEEAGETEELTETTEATEEPAATEEPVTEEMVEAARQAILDSKKEVISEIMAKYESGTSFEDLIAEYGTDPGMQKEKNLKNGYSVHKDSVSFYDVFTKAAAALEKVGDVSEPVVSSKGIHILYYLRDVPGGALELSEDELAQVRTGIENERINLAISELLDKWSAEADIVWTAEGEAWKYDQSVEEAYREAVKAEEASETEDAPEAEAVPETEAAE